MSQHASNRALPGQVEGDQAPETDMEESHETEEGSASASMAVDTPPSSTFTSTSAPPQHPTTPLSQATSPIWPPSSDRNHTSMSIVESMAARQYPQLHLRALLQRQHLPLPEREDSSRPRPITFGSLKKASMSTSSSYGPEGGSKGFGNHGKNSKMTHLPSYLRHTTFSHHFQPEGAIHDLNLSTSPSLPEREHSKRRRLADNRRRQHTHFHRHSDSSSSGSSSDGSDSGHSSHESGTSTPVSGDTRPLRYQLPSRWSTVDKTEKTELLEDDLLVHYTGPGKADSDASAIRANRPIPPQCGIYYYEVFIKSKGQQGYIGIGVCNSGVALDRLPGWEPQSWGYHGDDGNSFGGCGNGRPFGPVFTTGDTIGCGVNFRDMSLFYTKNGAYLGVAFRDLKGPLYPTVGMRTVGEIVEANFGQQEFLFDIEEYVKRGGRGPHDDVSMTPTTVKHGKPNLSVGDDRSSSVLDAERRKNIRIAIMAGEIDCAMRLLEDHYPGIMDQNEDMLLQLRCRKFVEMVTSSSSHLKALDKQEKLGGSHHDMEMADTNGYTQRKTDTQLESTPEPMDVDQANNLNKSLTARKKAKMVDESATPTTKGASSDEGLEGLGRLKDAIKYGQYLQEQYRDSQRSSIQDMLIDSFSVLAYSDPEPGVSLTASAPVSKPITRKAVADTVNTAILASQNLPTTAPLEAVYRQTKVLLSELMRRGVGEAAFFDLNRDCLE
ncbi:hypothetical protein BG006_009945 [Podila minutissima]|uniref:SPRY-domain-containing protein n=1 Tax=Podila minutissima TaxID=64525 RepID=A0A9P5VIV8_9FUNG|nr:hypothetical protein BG006_009945 [Podila minutissima]